MESAHKKRQHEAKATLHYALAALSARDFDTTRALVIDSDIDICAGTAIDAAAPFANGVDFPELVGVNTASRHIFAVESKWVTTVTGTIQVLFLWWLP